MNSSGDSMTQAGVGLSRRQTTDQGALACQDRLRCIEGSEMLGECRVIDPGLYEQLLTEALRSELEAAAEIDQALLATRPRVE